MVDLQPVETTLYSLDAAPPKGTQRRNSERHLSMFRVGSLIVGERRELCLIRNISAGGMLIRVYCAIEAGECLSVELKQGESITGVARWVKDDCVGVTFDRPIDVVGLISSPLEGKQPRMPRIEVGCAAWVREGASVYRVTAADVSQGGVKVVTPSVLSVGADVVVTLTGLTPMAGVVRWRDGDAWGIAFHRAVGLTMLVAWLQAQQQRHGMRAAG